MSATAEARFVAGVLAADGSLRPDITVDDAVRRLERLVGPASVWCTTLPANEGWELFDEAVTRVPVPWEEPDAATLDEAAVALDAAFAPVARLMRRPAYIEPVLRVMPRTPADAGALQHLGRVGGLQVTGFVPERFGRWTWCWPLRVGVVAADPDGMMQGLGGDGEYTEHYRLEHRMAGDHEPLDLLIVDWRLVDALRRGDLGPVGAAIVTRPPGDDSPMADRAVQVARAVLPGAVVALEDDELGWFEPLVRELSHDRPLDAAVGLVMPDALVVGSPEFMTATSIRNWARLVADQVDHRDPLLATELRGMIAEVEFERERGGARDLGAAVRDRLADGTIEPVEGAPPVRAAVGSESEPDAAAASDDRRLVSKVTDARGVVRSNGFVAGRVHQLLLRVADKAGKGETAASDTLASPQPGTHVTLDVTVHVEGSSKRLPPVKLIYPAAGNGDWTKPLKFTAPRRNGDLRLFVSVAWQGRVIQSATLSGPLHDPARADDLGELTFEVDRSSGIAALGDRPAADATIIQVPASDRRPAILDAHSVVSIDPDILRRANSDVRQALIDTFMDPPESLEDVAGRLTGLAIRGSLLRDALRGKEQTFYDDDPWIHVMSFGGPPISYELVYTHPMPSSRSVPVCGPALAGATSCAEDCPDRERDDRVCPLGFWATTKIVERRLHSSGRDDSTASDERVVTARDGGVAAVADIANLDDPNASKRIMAAVSSFVRPGTAVEARTWNELEGAVATPRQLVCLVTHTEGSGDTDALFGIELQVGADLKELVFVDKKYVNPDLRAPGPVVLAIGCDTATISASFASFVSRLHSLGAEIVVSAISQIPGKEAADFVERFTTRLGEQLSKPGVHRFGEVMTAVRVETLLKGDVMALALTASGDGDVCLRGAP